MKKVLTNPKIFSTTDFMSKYIFINIINYLTLAKEDTALSKNSCDELLGGGFI